MWEFSLKTFVIIAAMAFSVNGNAQEPRPRISVSGTAVVRVVPDEVVLTAAVESRARTVTEAAKENEQKIAAVIAFLKTAEVAERNIRTEYMGITPIMSQVDRYKKGGYQIPMQTNLPPTNSPQVVAGDEEKELKTKIEPIGFSVQRQFSIRVTDLTRFEAIYTGLVESGINNVKGIEFESSEIRQHKDDVRLKAVKAAREKAEAMAGELGATLASVISIEEADDRYARAPMMTNSLTLDPFGGDEASFAAGELSISARVSVVFELGNSEMTK